MIYMLEKFVQKHLGPKSLTGKALFWYGERVILPAFEYVFLHRTNSRRVSESLSVKPQQIGGLTDEQALARFKAFRQSSRLKADLDDLLAHTVKDKRV